MTVAAGCRRWRSCPRAGRRTVDDVLEEQGAAHLPGRPSRARAELIAGAAALVAVVVLIRRAQGRAGVAQRQDAARVDPLDGLRGPVREPQRDSVAAGRRRARQPDLTAISACVVVLRAPDGDGHRAGRARLVADHRAEAGQGDARPRAVGRDECPQVPRAVGEQQRPVAGDREQPGLLALGSNSPNGASPSPSPSAVAGRPGSASIGSSVPSAPTRVIVGREGPLQSVQGAGPRLTHRPREGSS